MLARHAALDEVPLVRDWSRRGWPVIIRRRIPGDEAGIIPAALPLPPSLGKRRIGFSFHQNSDITKIPAVTLAGAADMAPAAWQPAIAALIALGRDAGSEPRVFGALLWERLTGLSYLTRSSDLDLLWRVNTEAAAATLLAGLSRIDATAAFQIDGELELPCGGGVNWRELLACGTDSRKSVLIKSMDSVTTCRGAHLFERTTCSV